MASYEKNKSSGLWSARFRAIENGKEKNMRLSGFKTKREAQAGYEKYVMERAKKAEEEKIKEADPNDMPFKQLVQLYLENQKTRVKESSFYDNKKKIEKRILPFFEKMTIAEMTPVVILQWQNSLQDISYQYKAGLRTILSSIIKFGERYYDIKNVMFKVEQFRNTEPKKEMLIWTPDEFKKCMDHIDDPTFEAYFWTLYITGARRSEIMALSWDDIDMQNKVIRIRKSIAKQSTINSPKIDTTKNQSSNRDVPIPIFLVEKLKAYQAWQAEKTEKQTFVFGGAKILSFTTLDRVIKKASKAAEVKTIRVHDLRHSCASLLISSGVSIVAVSKRLGHATVKQTLDTYSHMMPDDQTMIIKTLERVAESQIKI